MINFWAPRTARCSVARKHGFHGDISPRQTSTRALALSIENSGKFVIIGATAPNSGATFALHLEAAFRSFPERLPGPPVDPGLPEAVLGRPRATSSLSRRTLGYCSLEAELALT